MSLTPKPGILDITPYVGGRASAHGVASRSSCRPTRRALGPSKAAVAAFREASGDAGILSRGRRARSCAMRSRETYGLDPARIVCGNGSDELLTMLAQRLSEARRRGAVQRARVSRLSHRRTRQQRGAGGGAGEGSARRCRCDAGRGDARRRVSSISPIRTIRPARYLPHDEVRRLHAGLRPDILLVLDAAYAEYVRRNDYEAGHRAGGELLQTS